jgi:LacI family transcriptional regulator
VAAAHEGTRHLISLGHRRILLLASDPILRNIRERVEGYRRALADADLLGFENVVVAGRNEAAHARQVVLPVLAGPGRPSALFAVTQTMTIGALQSLWEAGLELPKDISLRKASLRRSRLADGNAGRTQGNALREVRR